MTPPAANAIRHERIMASAGSGKTFQLTNRYLRLILEHADPGSILASTFTRLAAGEIRDRILERLAEAAADDRKRSELAQHAGVPSLSRDDALTHLVQLTRRLHQLQVRTLDSFFAGIVRCFALELGIDPASQVVDEDTEQQLRRETIARMLDEADPQPMIDLLRVLTEGSTERSVTDSIDDLVKHLYELYRDAPREAWEAIEPVPMLSRADLIDAVQALELGDVETTHKSVIAAHRDDFHRAGVARYDSYEDWLAFLSKGIACAIVTGKDTYYKQTIPPTLAGLYQPLLEHAHAVVHNSVVNRTRAMHNLLDRFHHCYEQIKLANKAMTFSDIIWKMAEAQQLGTMDEICYRLDATLRHVLLDEMQDTNIAQWRALQPIVAEIISYAPPERSFFCVGDVKQSIYGWREACPEILETLCDLALDGDGNSVIAGDRQLAKSWRSSPVIMSVVNNVLTRVQDNPAMAEFSEAASLWDAAFVQHETAKQHMPGYVELRTASRAGGGQQQSRVRLRDAAGLIKQLHEQCPAATIGVLTRTNKTVNTLLYELGPSRLNIPASGRGGGALTDSAAVNVILDLLRLADHPDHTIAAFNVMHSPLGELVGLRRLDDCKRVSSAIRRRVLTNGFGPCIQQWIAAIGEHTDPRQLRRLIQLMELAVEFDRRPTLRCDDFLDMVQSQRVDDSSGTPVQVMTVHQSKGLEFDIVILPELQGEIVSSRNPPKLLYQRDGAAGPITCVARHLKNDVTSKIPQLAAMHDAYRQRRARESLCLLYVAMTRARHALHIIIDPSSEREKTLPKTLAGLLRCALIGTDTVDEEQVLFTDGQHDWHTNIQWQPRQSAADAMLRTDHPPTFTASRGTVPRGRTSLAASASSHHDNNFASQLKLQGSESRERGTVIHALFEQVTWLDDGDGSGTTALRAVTPGTGVSGTTALRAVTPGTGGSGTTALRAVTPGTGGSESRGTRDWQPNRDTLMQLVHRKAPRRDAAWAAQQVDAFLQMIAHPTIKATLSRGEAADDSLQLHRELPFARMVNGAVQLGYIDRLVAHVVDGKAVDATIIDFKTDDVPVEAVAARAEGYRTQLETYRTAAASALGIDEVRITMTLLFTTCGEVVRL